MGAAAAKMLPAAKMLQAAAGPLDDDNLLSEILLRLPPQPSSLPRASAVCKRWRSLVTDRGFIRRFRLRHRRNPPLLGYFHQDADILRFQPTMEPPNGVPPGRFSCPIDDGDSFMLLGCRHGLVLFLLMAWDQFLVWDPVTGDQHRVALATHPWFDVCKTKIDGTVLRSAGDDHHFQVVMVGYDDTRAFAFIYSSVTRLWSTLLSAPLPEDVVEYDYGYCPGVLVGNILYWRLSLDVMLEVDLCRQSISVHPVPVDIRGIVMRAEGGGVGLLSLSDYTVKLWKRNIDCHGVASWVVGRSFELDKLLTLDSQKEMRLIGYAEENNVVLLRTFRGIYVVQLESLQFSKLSKIDEYNIWFCSPFESVYAAGIGGGHDGADQDMLV